MNYVRWLGGKTMNSFGKWSNFYWIGGAACGGKTSITTALAEKHGWILYKCDEHAKRRKQFSTRERTPMLFELPERPLDDVLLNIPMSQQVEEYKQFLMEDFPLIIEDLQQFPKDATVIVEGNHLLPHLLPEYIDDPKRAIWITPTKEFYNAHFYKRKWILERVKTASDPELALHNWALRSELFVQWIDETVRANHLTLFKTAGDAQLEDRIAAIEKHWGLLS